MHDEDTCCVDGCSQPPHVRRSRRYPHLSGACKYHYHAEASARPGLDLDPRDCVWCDTRFRPRRLIERCCSKKCSLGWSKYGCEDALLRRRVAALASPVMVSGRPAPQPRLFTAAFCSECGEGFVRRGSLQGPQGGRIFCSRACGRRTERRDHRHRRRAGRAGQRIYRAKVFERDGWACRLCGDPLDRSADVPHPLAAVIDHIVPLALGGEHAHYNVQAAHFICNSHKRDVLEGQVAMPV